ncbi:MAG TPA: NADH-quinone oxidoreductase subunit M [Solirubrobacteraceae bacterium]|nr:NADH-quinone oxidoreductase subunit M [Solirubrobacteraceae bacterium]
MTLSILIWLPLAISLVAAVFPRDVVGRVAAVGSLVTLGIAISFLARFKLGHAGLQFVTNDVWISALGIHYKLGLDGLNVALVVLTTVLFSASLVWASFREWDRPRSFYFHFGLAQSAVLGAFCAQDLALFVGFFDLMLIPFYFLVGMWGTGPDRVRATTKLVVYTLVGSFFMLVAAVATGVLASSDHNTPINFTFSALRALPLPHASQEWIFLCFAFAFLVKMPLVPFHGWLADGYKAMPIPAVAVFSGVVSKVAAYGFLRIVLPLFPYAAVHFQTLMLLVALVSIIWGTVVAFTTPDARMVVAYSSVAQLSFIVLGIFSLRPTGDQGALLQMLNHGLVTAALFFIVAAAAARAGGSERLADMGGIAFRAPVLAALALIVTLATLAMPGSANWIGEFMILLGVFQSKIAISVIAFVGVVGAAYYALRLFIGVFHNRVGSKVASREIGLIDVVALAPIVLIILVLAFYPQFGLRRSEPSVRAAIAPAQAQAALGGLPSAVALR